MSRHETSNTSTKIHRAGEIKFHEHFKKKFACSKEAIRRTFVKLEAYMALSQDILE